MKKIVGIMAAAAMAASMFAVDVSGQLWQKTTLFSDAKTVLTAPETPTDINNSHIKFAVSKGDAGASFNFADTNSTWQNITVWCTPFEGLKLTLGQLDTGSLNRGTYAWWHRAIRIQTRGVEFNFNAGPVAMDFVTSFDVVDWDADNSALLNFNDKGLAILGDYFVTGTINMGSAGNIQLVSARGADMNAYGVGGWKQANLLFGLSYDHMPWQTTGGFADVYVNLTDNFAFEQVGAQLGAQFCGSGMAARLVAMVGYGDKWNGETSTTDKGVLSYGFIARGEYTIDAYNTYVQVMGHEMVDGKYEVEVGCDTNLGSAALNAAVNLKISKGGVGYSIPLTFKVGM